jgi:hypothetical protein
MYELSPTVNHCAGFKSCTVNRDYDEQLNINVYAHALHTIPIKVAASAASITKYNMIPAPTTSSKAIP